jgi:hypothetical protein
MIILDHWLESPRVGKGSAESRRGFIYDFDAFVSGRLWIGDLLLD